MKNFAQIVTKINSSVWLMEPDAIRKMLEILERHMLADDDEIKLFAEAFADDNNHEQGPQIVDGVGILNLEGPIFPKANLMTELSGATSLQSFGSELDSLVSNDRVHSVLLNIDSPGGVSDHVLETARRIRSAGEAKPIVAIANTMATSAALWLAAAANEFYITDSGLTGSLGVYTVHVDTSEADKAKGVLKTVIHAGKAKGANEQPLNDYTRKNLQETVDDAYDLFLSAVADYRGVDKEYAEMHFGDGGVITPRKAAEVGLVDGIKTFEELAGELAGNGGVVGSATEAVTLKALTSRGYVISNTNAASATMLSHNDDSDKEHGDPGPQGEPIPKLEESPDKAMQNGWRVPTPPQSSYPIRDAKGGKTVVNRAWLEAVAQKLNLTFTDETSDDDLTALVDGAVDDIVVPLVTAETRAVKARSWENDYPDQADELRELREERQENKARRFASRWERFTSEDTEGKPRKTTNGFSARTLQDIEKIHLSLTRRQLTEDDIATLLDGIAEAGFVDYSERGSSRSREEVVHDRQSFVGMDIREIRETFATEVRKVMENDSVDRKTAMNLVAERDPELAEMYRTGHLRVR